MSAANGTLHPTAQWAIEVGFNAEQVDCTTVVLKILDNKCKMLPAAHIAETQWQLYLAQETFAGRIWEWVNPAMNRLS
jgi:hypothetical protein